MLCIYLVVLLITTGNLKLWVVIGCVIGLGLQTKYTIALLAFGLPVGVILTPLRSQLRTPWPWLGAIVAIVIISPNIVWQITHQFPFLEFTRNNNAEVQQEQTRIEFILQQLLLAGPATLPLLFFGAWFFWDKPMRSYRILGWAILTSGLILFIVNGKPYYFAPLYPLLFIGGAIAIERWLSTRPRWLPIAALTFLVLMSVPPLPAVLPISPVQTMAQWKVYKFNEDFAEMIGWQEALEQIETIHKSLPQTEQTVVLTVSYGEAAAVDVLGHTDQLPPVISAHNTYYYWSANHLDADHYIVLGYSAEHLATLFDEVQPIGVITNSLGISNELNGQPIHICRKPKRPLAEQWPQLKHFN